MIDQGITLGENAMGSVQAKEKIKPFAEDYTTGFRKEDH